MFERFSKTARRAVVVAQEEARELRSPQIDVEHVLLGVLSSPDAPLRKILTDNGITAEQIRDRLTTEISSEPLGADDAAALESIGIDLEAVRDSVQATFGEDVFDEPAPAAKGRGKFRLGGIVNFGHIPFSKDAKKTLELSLREAISRGDDSMLTAMAVALVGPGNGEHMPQRHHHRQTENTHQRPGGKPVEDGGHQQGEQAQQRAAAGTPTRPGRTRFRLRPSSRKPKVSRQKPISATVATTTPISIGAWSGCGFG